MQRNGFIAIDRNIVNWQWFDDLYVLKVWIYILVNANWQDGYFQGEPVPRGSFVTSYRHLARELKMTDKTVQKCIKKLKKTGEIETKCTTRFTIIKVLKYAEYQDLNFENGTRRTTQRTTQDTTQRTTQDTTQRTTNITNKPYNQETINQETNLRDKSLGRSQKASESDLESDLDRWFSDFWKLYPRKVAKATAEKSFRKACTDEAAFNQIMEGLRYQIDAVFSNREERYIPHPSTWLNQQRWNDRPKAEAPDGVKHKSKNPAWYNSTQDETELADATQEDIDAFKQLFEMNEVK